MPSCPFLRPWEACSTYNDSSPTGLAAARHITVDQLAMFDASFSSLLPALAGRTVLFVGDSVQRQLFVAFVCSLFAVCPSCMRQSDVQWFRPTSDTKNCHGQKECEFSRACITYSPSSTTPYVEKRGPLRFNRRGEITFCLCDVSQWMPATAASVVWAKPLNVNLANPMVARCFSPYKHLRRQDVVVYGSCGLHRMPSVNSQNQLVAQAEQARRLSFLPWVLTLTPSHPHTLTLSHSHSPSPHNQSDPCIPCYFFRRSGGSPVKVTPATRTHH